MRPATKKLIPAISTSLLSLLPLGAAGAEDAPSSPGAMHGDGWSLGLGIVNSDSTYIDYDERFPVFPIIEYTTERFTFSPLGVSYRLFTTHANTGEDVAGKKTESDWGLTLHTHLGLGFGDRDEDESKIFEDMEERKYGSTAGLSAELSTPVGAFELSVNTDIADASEGNTVEVSYGLPLYFSEKLVVMGSLGALYHDQNYTDYYYGVRETEVRPDRLAYRAEAATNTFLGYTAIYLVSKKWRIIHSAQYITLDDEVVDSTLTTDEDNQLETLVAISYSF